MKNTMGIIFTGGGTNRLKELTDVRSLSAIPVGGKYRAIDFVLSSMVNSGITNVGVITQYNFRSLMDHLGSGKEWDLDRRYNGLFIFPPYLSGNDTSWYRGTADAMYNNITFLNRSDEEYVLIAKGDCVYNMSFDKLLEYHVRKNADITMVYREMKDYTDEELSLLGLLEIDDEGRIADIREKSMHPLSTDGSMGIYFLKRRLLVSLLEECAAHGYYDFLMDVLIKKLGELRIYGFKFEGYWRNLSTAQLYYRCNMELLNPELRHELFFRSGRIYTKVKDEPPAKYNEEAEVRNSIVADGCIIEGTVENSVLFRGVSIKKGAVVRNSIIMQGSSVQEGAFLQNVILDKNVYVNPGRSLKGEPSWPLTVSKDVVV